jgi:predicted acetyltransferase
MRLVKPTIKYQSSWKKALQEFEKNGEMGFWNFPGNRSQLDWDVPESPRNVKNYIQLTNDLAQGEDIPKSWVSATTFWLIDQEKFIGHCNIRHRLNKLLKVRGGHIGYAIRPSARNEGYGKIILQLALKKAKLIGLKRVLVTCDDDNIPSQKIIESNGGKLRDKITHDSKLIRRYWISLTQT